MRLLTHASDRSELIGGNEVGKSGGFQGVTGRTKLCHASTSILRGNSLPSPKGPALLYVVRLTSLWDQGLLIDAPEYLSVPSVAVRGRR